MRQGPVELPDMIDAFNRSDWTMFRSHLSPDVVFEESGTGRQAEGPDAYVALLQAWHSAFPDVHGTITDTLLDGDRLARRLTWTGTHTGPLAAPGLTIPPTGRTVRVEAIQWITLRDKKIVRVFHHLDVMGMLQQLGVLNMPDPQAAPIH